MFGEAIFMVAVTWGTCAKAIFVQFVVANIEIIYDTF